MLLLPSYVLVLDVLLTHSWFTRSVIVLVVLVTHSCWSLLVMVAAVDATSSVVRHGRTSALYARYTTVLVAIRARDRVL